MANAKYWLHGKHLSSITVFGGTRSAVDGSMTWASGTTLTGSVDFIRANAQNLLDMIVSVDAGAAHYEPTIIDSGVSIGEILKANGNVLDGIAFGFTYAGVMFTRGSRSFAFYGVIDTYQDGVTALGKNASVLNLKQIAIVANGGLSSTGT